jgi:hypothetical protein
MLKCCKGRCSEPVSASCPCGAAQYCSEEHAEEDWERHQYDCNELKTPMIDLTSDNWITVERSSIQLAISDRFADILRQEPEGPVIRWFGKDFNLVSGLLYFLQHYPNDCAPLTSYEVSGEEIIKENYILDSTAIEFHWNGKKLVEPDDFAIGMRACLKRPNIRFIFSLLSMRLPANEGGGLHANAILYDTRTREVEVFEPQLPAITDRIPGNKESFYDPMYRAVAASFRKVIRRKITLYSPFTFCPVGPQTMTVRRLQVQDPGGFCGAWSLWWINARLENAEQDISREQLIESALEQFRDMKNPTTFIRNYASYILEQRDELIREAITEWNRQGDVEKFLSAISQKSARFNWLTKKLQPLRAKKRLTKKEQTTLNSMESELKTLLIDFSKTLTLDEVTLRQYVLLGYEKRLREFTE